MPRSHARRVALTSSLALLVGAGSPIGPVEAHSVAYKAWRASPSMADGEEIGGFELSPKPAPAGVLPPRTAETPGANGFELLPQAPTAEGANARVRPAAPSSAVSADQVIPAGPSSGVVNGFEVLPAAAPVQALAGPTVELQSAALTLRPAAEPLRLSPGQQLSGFELTTSPPAVGIQTEPAPEPEATFVAVVVQPLSLRDPSAPALARPQFTSVQANAPSLLLEPAEEPMRPVELALQTVELRPAAPQVQLTTGQGAGAPVGGRAPDIVLASAPEAVAFDNGFQMLPATAGFSAAEAAAVAPSLAPPRAPSFGGLGQALGADQVFETLPSPARPGERDAFQMVDAPEAPAAPAVELASPSPVVIASAAAPQLERARPDRATATAVPQLDLFADVPAAPQPTVEVAPAVMQLASVDPVRLEAGSRRTAGVTGSAPQFDIQAQPAPEPERSVEVAPAVMRLASVDPVRLESGSRPAQVAGSAPQLDIQAQPAPPPERSIEVSSAVMRLASVDPVRLDAPSRSVRVAGVAPQLDVFAASAPEPVRTVALAPAMMRLASAEPVRLDRSDVVTKVLATTPQVELVESTAPERSVDAAPAVIQLAAATPVRFGGADFAPARVSGAAPQLDLFTTASEADAAVPTKAEPIQLAQVGSQDTPAPATQQQLQLPPAPSPVPPPTSAAPPPASTASAPAGNPSANQTSATQPGTPITATIGAQNTPANPAPAPAEPESAAPSTTAPGQAPAPAGPERQLSVVGRIIVQGNERIEPSTILSYLPIQPGDTVDAARLDLAVKTLVRTGLFGDVSMGMQGTDLVVKVSENPIINQVVFEGNHALKEDKLRDEVTIRPRGIFTRSRVEQDVQRIIELYRRSGRISASVTPKIVQLPQKRVDLIFEIDEGPKSGILHINFIGNKSFSDNALGDVIVTRESHWYKFFQSNDNYDPDRLEYDREQLRKFYRNHGFYDFRIISAVAELAPDRNGFIITFTIDEGPKYHFGKLKVDTQLKRLNGELLQALLPIREGQLYEDDRIEKATDSLTYAAGANGFAFVDVRPRFTPHPDTRTVDVTFDIREGPRVYIERIDVVGNTQTLDRVIRREMRVSEGDAYNRVLVDRSKNQIRALGFFKDVDIEQLPGSAPDKTILRVKVSEQPTGQLTFSLGYSSLEKLVGDVGISQSNFRGRGQQVNFQVSLGYLRKQVILSFTEPRFMGRNMSAGFDLYTYRYNFSDQASFQSSSTGLNLKTGFPINQYSTTGLRYSLHSDTVSLPSYVVDPTTGRCIEGYSQSLCDELGTALTSSIGYSVRWDRRNDPLLPTRGFYVDFSQDFAGVGGDVQYVRSEVNGAWYYGFTPSWILSFQGSGGYITGWGGDDVRINDRFFRGGETFRGFEIAGIGPRDVSLVSTSGAPIGDALGGKLYGIGTVELTVPTPIPQQYGIKTSLFTDFGTLGLLDERVKRNPDGTVDPNIKDDLAFRAAAGITVKWRSPMGPLQFDFSKVLKKAPYDRTETFRFSTATRF